MAANKNVLVLLAHPALEKSRVNRPLAETAASVSGVTVHDLYETYPRFFIRKTEEQQRLLGIDVIVMQHPMYWYNAPALLKEWQDIVLEHGFAYGDGGDALRGKALMNAFSAGSTDNDFEDEFDPMSLRQLMSPFEWTARYCGMRYLPPFTTYCSGSISSADIDKQCEGYRTLLEGFVRGELDPQDLERHATIGAALAGGGHV